MDREGKGLGVGGVCDEEGLEGGVEGKIFLEREERRKKEDICRWVLWG